MKIGINSAILEHYNLEEMIDFASKSGFESVEVACWPQGKASRRYAGVSHIDVENVKEANKESILKKFKDKNLEISALAYYPNVLDKDEDTGKNSIKHLYKVIDAAAILGVNMVTTFIGRNHSLSLDENFKLFEQVWPSIINYAEDKNVCIAIENCPMWFSNDEWPGGKNLFTSPSNWRRAFEIIPNKNFGINYDPSHFVWQQIDYIKPLYEFKDKIFHVHFKDIKVYKDKLNDVGIMANPLEYMAPKLVGLGDIDWGKYVSALNDIDFKGHACIEIEDKSFENSTEDINNSVLLSLRYLKQFVI